MAKGTTSGARLSQAERHRKQVNITLSDEAREELELLAIGVDGGKSGAVEALLLDSAKRRGICE